MISPRRANSHHDAETPGQVSVAGDAFHVSASFPFLSNAFRNGDSFAFHVRLAIVNDAQPLADAYIDLLVTHVVFQIVVTPWAGQTPD
jgi:hypothetical protein